MSHKTRVLTLVFVVVAMIGFARILTLHGQEYYEVGAEGVNVETCKDFNALTAAQQEAWVDGFNTAVVRFVADEQDQALYQVDDVDALASYCEENPKKGIDDATLNYNAVPVP